MKAAEYSIETLFHFHCQECNNWWTVGDWNEIERNSDKITCPHCSQDYYSMKLKEKQ